MRSSFLNIRSAEYIYFITDVRCNKSEPHDGEQMMRTGHPRSVEIAGSFQFSAQYIKTRYNCALGPFQNHRLA